MRLRLLFSIFALSSLGFAGTFDKPASKKVVDLGPSRSNPPGRNANDQTRAKVTCYYFSGFMVKEVDMGEKGAERLAIVPVRKNEMHTCSRLRDPGEREISSDDWSGYFMGVKGHLVFFLAVRESKTANPMPPFHPSSALKNTRRPFAPRKYPDQSSELISRSPGSRSREQVWPSFL